MRDPDLEALSRCVGDVGEFADRHWGRSPVLAPGRGAFDDLLDLDAVDALLTTAARRPTFRLVRDGETLPPSTYTGTIRLGGKAVDDVADVVRIAELVDGGATLVLQGLHRTWPPLTQFCRALERATSHPVQANAYLTPPGAAGLARHGDRHDVLVLQVLGSKDWDVDGLGAVQLRAGDALYLPLGTGHAAAAQAEPSLHLTIGLLRETDRAVVERLLGAAGALAGPLPLGYARPERRGDFEAHVATILERAAAEVGAAEPAAVADAEVRRARSRRRPLLHGQLGSVLALGVLDDGTKLRRRLDNPAVLEDGPDGRLTLRLADRTLRLPATARPALETVLGNDTFAVGDLAALTESGRAVLARRLVREGLLLVES